MINNLKNFAVAKLTSKPNSSATTVTLDTGEDAWMPDILPAKMIMWDKGSFPDTILARRNGLAEVVDVTDVTGSTVTITRESSPVDFSSAIEVWMGQGYLSEKYEKRFSSDRKTSAYTALVGDIINGDTSGGAWTLTLPASPSDGDTVIVIDVDDNWEDNNLTVSGNGNDILGDSTFVCDIIGVSALRFVWSETDSEWKVK